MEHFSNKAKRAARRAFERAIKAERKLARTHRDGLWKPHDAKNIVTASINGVDFGTLNFIFD